jgi:hypothetical protein
MVTGYMGGEILFRHDANPSADLLSDNSVRKLRGQDRHAFRGYV